MKNYKKIKRSVNLSYLLHHGSANSMNLISPPKPGELSFMAISVSTSHCSNNVNQIKARGEIPTEPDDSWLTPKQVEA
jgi:hypothetical protein